MCNRTILPYWHLRILIKSINSVDILAKRHQVVLISTVWRQPCLELPPWRLSSTRGLRASLCVAAQFCCNTEVHIQGVEVGERNEEIRDPIGNEGVFVTLPHW